MKIYTIGHSGHTKDQFLKMLSIADINYVADIRAFPASRKFPHFNKENLKYWLDESNIEYCHFPLLGGRRQRSGQTGETLNDGWKNRSFHNYADYTMTDDFKRGIEQLKTRAEKKNLVYMCSERHPARCHRLLISNWLEANRWEVFHIINGPKDNPELVRHELGKWGAVPIIESDGTVVYPNHQD
ncbi:DNA repair protein [Halalkalibacillus sediminis]|uniref:DNA repair protein n=1 Tax=Halalkalibacillus sediminis TaxID=2018042 RepID=A0A2I0QUP2_9BACI|nr:DUF488 domain-containing protein [Halalkalibacillus sediminis]PKR78067.1 DNA repair protein [Halalkalibacillus sediminis]